MFLIFLLDGPVDLINICRAKSFIPNLLHSGYITGDQELSITDLGREVIGTKFSAEEKATAHQRFFTTTKSDRLAETESKAELFISLYRHGSTYQEIGTLHNITRERVRQILNATPKYAELLAEHKQAKAELKRRQKNEKVKQSKLKRIEKSLANQFPDRVDQLWDFEKNAGIDPAELAARSTLVKIWWKCPIDGHSWKKKPVDIVLSWTRSKTSGCPVCAGKKNKPEKQPALIEQYADLVQRSWDFEKNNAQKLFPDKVTLGSNQYANFKCPIHQHKWVARVHSVVKQQWAKGNIGCQICNGTLNRNKGEWKKAGKLAELYPKQIQAFWLHLENDQIGLDPKQITIGSSKSAWFKCTNANHIWQAKISSIRRSWDKGRSGCPNCWKEQIVTPQ